MIEIAPGDLVAVEADGEYYYALILDRVKLFGGNWVFAFHASSGKVLDAAQVFAGPRDGFNAFADFIWAKREARIVRVGRKLDTSPFLGPGRLKGTHATKEKAAFWFIYDMTFKELKRVKDPSPQEARYPEHSRIDDVIMVRKAKARWTPERDARI